MTLARHLTLCLTIAAAASTHAQQTDAPAPAPKTPAPIVRRPTTDNASTAADTDATTPAPKPIHLTTAKPVAPKPIAPKAIATPTAPVQPTPQTQPTPAAPGPFNRTTIVLDASHGGGDTGSRINDSLTEKDITLAFAFRLRSLLQARGFNVVMTRTADPAASAASNAPGEPLSLDERAGTANHARAVACLLLHATAAGKGVHLYTSELAATPAEPVTVPWLTAQAAWVTQSQRLATNLAAALSRAKIPVVQSRASVRPVDSLTCPALVVELAPNTADSATLADTTYQQHAAEALATALVFWQSQAQPPPRLQPPPPPVATPAPATAPEAQP